MAFFQAFALLLLPFLLGLHWLLAFFQALSFLLPTFSHFFSLAAVFFLIPALQAGFWANLLSSHLLLFTNSSAASCAALFGYSL
jgi:hypothetical protein